jgi:hypothetical protein
MASMKDKERRETPQERDSARQWTTTKILLRLIVMLLVTLTVVLLKRYGGL